MLTLQFVPYQTIQNLTSTLRIKKLVDISKENKIVLLEGRLKKVEEAELIKTTMSEINDDFKGIELHVIYPKYENENFFKMAKSKLLNILLGDRQGFTIIGPASIVKEIKNNPEDIQLLIQEKKKTKSNFFNKKFDQKHRGHEVHPEKSD